MKRNGDSLAIARSVGESIRSYLKRTWVGKGIDKPVEVEKPKQDDKGGK